MRPKETADPCFFPHLVQYCHHPRPLSIQLIQRFRLSETYLKFFLTSDRSRKHDCSTYLGFFFFNLLLLPRILLIDIRVRFYRANVFIFLVCKVRSGIVESSANLISYLIFKNSLLYFSTGVALLLVHQ